MTYDGSSRAGGLVLYLDGRRADCEVVRDKLTKNITGGGGDELTVGQRFRDRGFKNGLVDEIAVFDRALTPLEVAQLHDGKTLARILATDPGTLSFAQRRDLFALLPRQFRRRVQGTPGSTQRICARSAAAWSTRWPRSW